MLMQTLQSLAAGKYKVLKRDTHGTVQHYYVNDSMKSKLVRIVLHTYQGRLTKKDVEVQLWWMMLVVSCATVSQFAFFIKATKQSIQRQRIFQIDAAIVRLLKARRTMPHQTLMLELQKHLRFDAQPQLLKKRVESLLERE